MSNTLPGIVGTKLTPPRAQHSVLPRGELVEELGADATRRVALITAPPGYGKTTLARLYVESIDLPFAWLSLDPSDSDFARFFAYLIAAIESAYPGMCVESRAGLAAATKLSNQLLADRLIRDITRLDGRFVLVLDDYHVIQDLAIHKALSRLIKRMPATLQIVIVARLDPPLPLSRLRAHGRLVEIRSDQLWFTQAESETYLGQIATLPPTSLADLARSCEGWPVGLNLLALSASRHPFAGERITRLSGHLADQAALAGILSHIYLLRYTIRSVQRVTADSQNSQASWHGS